MQLNDSDRTALLEQYKLYVEMADRVSSRRVEANKLYSTLMTGLLAFVPFALAESERHQLSSLILGMLGIFGLTLSVVWMININSYKQLNSLKFAVIHEMEAQLVFAPYDREWQLLRDKASGRQYLRLSKVERYVPALLSIPYIVLVVLSLSYLH